MNRLTLEQNIGVRSYLATLSRQEHEALVKEASEKRKVISEPASLNKNWESFGESYVRLLVEKADPHIQAITQRTKAEVAALVDSPPSPRPKPNEPDALTSALREFAALRLILEAALPQELIDHVTDGLRGIGKTFKNLADLVVLLNEEFQANGKQVLGALVREPGKVADNLLGGLKLGFADFFRPKDIYTRLQGTLLKWLFGSLKDLPGLGEIELPDKFNAEGLSQFAFDLVGKVTKVGAITPEFVKAQFKQQLQAQAGIPVKTIEAVQDRVLALLPDLRKDPAGTLKSELSKIPEFGAAIYKTVFAATMTRATTVIIPAVMGSVVKAVFPGVGGLVTAYKGLEWVTENKDRDRWDDEESVRSVW